MRYLFRNGGRCGQFPCTVFAPFRVSHGWYSFWKLPYHTTLVSYVLLRSLPNPHQSNQCTIIRDSHSLFVDAKNRTPCTTLFSGSLWSWDATRWGLSTQQQVFSFALYRDQGCSIPLDGVGYHKLSNPGEEGGRGMKFYIF